MTGRLAGKVALISGAARGMGASHAREMAAQGASVVCGDILDSEGEGVVAKELGERPGARYVHLDVTRPQDWEAAVATAVARIRRTRHPGQQCRHPEHRHHRDYPLAEWQRILDINLTGVFLGVRGGVTPTMKAAGHGSIINISSIEGMAGTIACHGYTATKFAVRGLTKSTALELGPFGIRVNSVHPGLVKTPMADWVPEDIFHSALGRITQPREVQADLVVYLASNDSSYSTGSEFVVNSGDDRRAGAQGFLRGRRRRAARLDRLDRSAVGPGGPIHAPTQLCPRADLQLAVDPGQIVLHGLGADEHRRRDVLVGGTGRCHLGDPLFGGRRLADPSAVEAPRCGTVRPRPGAPTTGRRALRTPAWPDSDSPPPCSSGAADAATVPTGAGCARARTAWATRRARPSPGAPPVSAVATGVPAGCDQHRPTAPTHRQHPGPIVFGTVSLERRGERLGVVEPADGDHGLDAVGRSQAYISSVAGGSLPPRNAVSSACNASRWRPNDSSRKHSVMPGQSATWDELRILRRGEYPSRVGASGVFVDRRRPRPRPAPSSG